MATVADHHRVQLIADGTTHPSSEKTSRAAELRHSGLNWTRDQNQGMRNLLGRESQVELRGSGTD